MRRRRLAVVGVIGLTLGLGFAGFAAARMLTGSADLYVSARNSVNGTLWTVFVSVGNHGPNGTFFFSDFQQNLPPPLTLESAAPSCETVPSNYTCTGSLPAGGTSVFTIGGDASTNGAFPVVPEAVGDLTDPNTSNNTVTNVLTIGGSATKLKFGGPLVFAPQQSYAGRTLVVSGMLVNAGTTTATGIYVADSFSQAPDEIDCGTTTMLGPLPLTGDFTCPDLAPGKSDKFSIIFTKPTEGVLNVGLNAYADGFPGGVTTSGMINVLHAPPPLQLTKTPDVSSIPENGEVTYTIRVTNPRSYPAPYAKVFDFTKQGTVVKVAGTVTPDGGLPVPLDDSQCKINKDPEGASCTPGDLAPGATLTMIVVIKAPDELGEMVDGAQAFAGANDDTWTAMTPPIVVDVTSGTPPSPPPPLNLSATPRLSTQNAHAVNAVDVAVTNPRSNDTGTAVNVVAGPVTDGKIVGASSDDTCKAAGAQMVCTSPDGIAAGDTFHETVYVQSNVPGTVKVPFHACGQNDLTLCTSDTAQYIATNPCVGPNYDPILCPDLPDAPLDVAKTPDHTNVQPGAIVNYTITVHNPRSKTTGPISLLDAKASDGTIVGVSPPDGCTLGNNRVVCLSNGLAKNGDTGDTWTVVVRVRAGNAGTLHNAVDVLAKNDATLDRLGIPAPPVTVSPDATPVTPPQPLDVTKTPSVTTAAVGSYVDYTITVHNPRDVHTGPLSLAEHESSGATLLGINSDHGQCKFSGETASCVVPDLGAGETWTAVVHTKVTRAGTVGDDVEVMSSTDTTLDKKQTATITVTPTGIPIGAPPPLQVTKTADAGTITPGSVAAFTVTVKNPRSLPTGPVSVADLVGVGGGYLVGAFADETDVVPGAVPDSLVIPSIPAGATYTLHFLVQTTSRPGTYGDTAEVMSSTDTTLDAKATSSVTTAGTGPPVKPPPLSITKTPDVTSVKRGGIVTYTITVSNPRSSDATNLLVTDGPLTGGVLDGIDPAADAIGVSCDAFRHSCTLGRLPAGQSFTVYVNVKATSSPVKNGATVLSKTDSTLDNKVTSSVTVTVHKR